MDGEREEGGEKIRKEERKEGGKGRRKEEGKRSGRNYILSAGSVEAHNLASCSVIGDQREHWVTRNIKAHLYRRDSGFRCVFGGEYNGEIHIDRAS